MRAELYFSGEPAKRALTFAREVIEAQGWLADYELTWEDLTMKRDSRLALYYPTKRASDEAERDQELKWLVERMQKLSEVMLSISRMLKDDPSPILVLEE